MISIVKTSKQDIVSLNQLLELASLPVVDQHAEQSYYFKATDKSGNMLGAIGLEVYGNNGLLRSMVVDESHRNKGIAKMLVNQIITESKKMNLKKLVLLTTTADKYFDKLNFERIQRNTVPDDIKQSTEFSTICPVSAIVMQKEL